MIKTKRGERERRQWERERETQRVKETSIRAERTHRGALDNECGKETKAERALHCRGLLESDGSFRPIYAYAHLLPLFFLSLSLSLSVFDSLAPPARAYLSFRLLNFSTCKFYKAAHARALGQYINCVPTGVPYATPAPGVQKKNGQQGWGGEKERIRIRRRVSVVFFFVLRLLCAACIYACSAAGSAGSKK